MSSQTRRTDLGASLGIAIVIAAIIWLLPRVFPFSQVPENWLADFRQAAFAQVAQPTSDIVIVSVTEDTLASFPYRSPLDRSFLANLLGALEAADVKAVGLDVLFDQPTEEAKDKALYDRLHNFSRPLVVVNADQSVGLTDPQLQFLGLFLDGVDTGYADLLTDRIDGTVRRIFPGKISPDGRNEPSFVAALAKAVGKKVSVKAERIDYLRAPPEQDYAFPAYPAHTAGFLPKEWFKDKIVLIGADLPMNDRHRTPLATLLGSRAGSLPGVVIHAQTLAQVLDGRSFPELGATGRFFLLLLASLAGMAFAFIDVAIVLRAAGIALVVVIFWGLGFGLYANGGPLLPLVFPSLAFIISAGAGSAYLGRRDREMKKFIRGAFTRYVSPVVVDQLMENPDGLSLGGERREVTYIFTDLASFTSLTERVEPSIMVGILNEYLDGMCRIVMEHGGTIDKIVGDAVAAFFGAPIDQPDHPQRAVACAVALDAFSEDYISKGVAKEHDVGITRIGVNTGVALIGNFGGEAFFDYTGHGDMVNTAARLESLNKHLGTRVCVSKSSAERCQDIAFRPVGSVVVKGKTEGIQVYEPVLDGGVSKAQLDAYNIAYGLLDQDDKAAEQAFLEILASAPGDSLANFHVQRLKRGESGTTIVMTEK